MRKLCGQRKRQDDPELLGRSTAEPGGVIAGDTDSRSSEDEDLLRGFLKI